MATTANLRQMQRLQEYARTPENINCVDCGYSPSTWASINLNVFVCMSCSGIHRMLGVHITQIRSLTLDKWQEAWVLGMFKMNNVKFNSYYEAKLPLSHKLSPSADDATRTAYIRAKYERKMFYGDPSERIASPVENNLSTEQRSMTPRTLRRMQRRVDREMNSDNKSSSPLASLPLPSASPTMPASTFDIFSVNQTDFSSLYREPTVNNAFVDIFGNMQISSSKVNDVPAKKTSTSLFSNMTLTTSSSANKALNAASATSSTGLATFPTEEKGSFVTTAHGPVFVKPKSSGFDINSFNFTAVPLTSAPTPASTPVAPIVASASTPSNQFDIFDLGPISSSKIADAGNASNFSSALQPAPSLNTTTRTAVPKVNIFGGITIKPGASSAARATSSTDILSTANLPDSQSNSSTTHMISSTKKINGKFITDSSGRQVFIRDAISNSWLDSYSEPTLHHTSMVSIDSVTIPSVFEHFESSQSIMSMPTISDFGLLNENCAVTEDEGSAFDFIDEERKDDIEDDPFAGLPGATDSEPATIFIGVLSKAELPSLQKNQPQANFLSSPTLFEESARNSTYGAQEEPSAFGALLDDEDHAQLGPGIATPESQFETESFATHLKETDKSSTFDNLLNNTSTAVVIEDNEEELSAFGNLLDDYSLSANLGHVGDNDAFLHNYASVFQDDEIPLPFSGNTNSAVVEDFDEDSLWNGGLLED